MKDVNTADLITQEGGRSVTYTFLLGPLLDILQRIKTDTNGRIDELAVRVSKHCYPPART